jgi:hypothetical protein
MIRDKINDICNRCPLCNKLVWFWNDRNFFEITPDWGLYVHKKCSTHKNRKNYINNWFKECFDKNGELK